MDKEKKKSLKKVGIYTAFNLLFSIILPLALIFIMAFISLPYVKTGSIPNVIYILIFLMLFILLIINEYLISIITKKILKDEQKISNVAFCSAIIKSIICTILIYLLSVDGRTYNNYDELIIEISLIPFFKLVSYLIATKFALKEKIMLKNIYFFAGYILLIVIILTLHLPNSLNKYFYSRQFSSIKLRNELVDNYNNNSRNNCEFNGTITYTHKFTEEELACFTSLKLSSNFTTKDIEKFVNLEKLEIENVDFDKEITFAKNEKLVDLDIKNSKILKFDSTMIPNVRDLSLVNTIMNDKNLNIANSNINSLYIDDIKIDNFSIINNLQLENIEIINSEINNFIFDNNPKIEITNSRYNHYLSSYNELTLASAPIDTIHIDKVENITFRNVNDMKKILFASNITFKSLNFENRKIYLENGEYLISKRNEVTTDSYYGIYDLKTDNLTVKDIDGSYKKEIYDNDKKLLTVK